MFTLNSMALLVGATLVLAKDMIKENVPFVEPVITGRLVFL